MEIKVDHLLRELELLLSDIAFTGLRNLQPITLQHLEAFKHSFRELNMTEGIRRIDLLTESIHQYHTGKIPVEEVANLFCSLEFYQKTVIRTLSAS